MRTRSVFMLLAVAFSLSGAAPSSTIPVVDLMTPFWSVWDSTAGKPPQQRVAAFKERVILPGLPVYADGQFRRDLSSDDAIAKYLDGLEPHIAQMRAVTAQLRQQWPLVEASVAKQLPDFSSDRIVVYFLPSFNHFNGQTHDIGDKIGVLFGVDGIVEYGSSGENVGVDIAHELFHIYQFETHPGYRTDKATLWQAVWGEGSAAYASQVLTPGATATDALMGDLAAAPSETVKALACGIQAKWSSDDRDDINAYIDAGQHPPNLPARGGYLIGYLVATDMGKTHSLAEIGKIDVTSLEAPMRSDVAKLCSTGAI